MDNYQALGYAMLALKDAGIPVKNVKKVIDCTRSNFDLKTESEADEQGHRWFNELEEQPEVWEQVMNDYMAEKN